jgi:hypothetical protein
MAKINVSISLKKSNGQALGSSISSGFVDTKSQALAIIQTELDARATAAAAEATEYQDAQAAFGS